MDRRDFIKSSAIAATSLFVPLSARSTSEHKIKLAILGTGSWGVDMTMRCALATGHFEIIGLCDINSLALNKAAEEVVKSGARRPRLFSSYLELYELEGLEAVAIATPTHWHALQFIDACKKGLHVYLEKPICYDIREGQAMLDAHHQARNVVQVDFPRVKGAVNGQVKSFIQSGAAGKIFQVHANINHHEGTLIEKEVPQTFDFDTFCGPAPKNKFLCEEYSDTPMWRGQHDFSRGILADWGIHYIHNIRKVLDLDLPDSVSAFGGITRNFTHNNADNLEVRFDYGSVPVYWSHKTWGSISPMPNNNYGIYYYGEKATIFSGDLGWEVYSANGSTKMNYGDVGFNPGDPAVRQGYLNMAIDLLKEFARQIRSNSNDGITNTLEDAYKTTASVIYADMAYLLKCNLTIDKATMNLGNNVKANQMLKREYRESYRHPYIS
jgi:predicted dehydrogenase